MEPNETNKVNEPEVQHNKAPNRKITFFNSFDEAEEHGLKQMATHSYARRLYNLEVLRKRTFMPIYFCPMERGHRLPEKLQLKRELI